MKSASVLTPRRIEFVVFYQPTVVLRTGRVFGSTWTNTRTSSTSLGGSVIFSGVLPVIAVTLGNCIDRPLPSSHPAVPPYGLPFGWPTPLSWPLGCLLTLTPTLSPRSPMVRLTRTNGPGPTRRFPSMCRMLGISVVRPPDRLPGPPNRHRVGFAKHQMSLQSVAV